MVDAPSGPGAAAFGMRFVGEPILGLPGDEPGADLAQVRLEHASDADILQRWKRASGVEQVVDRALPDGQVFLQAWRSAEGAHRIWAPAHGHLLVEAGATHVWSRPPPDPRSWRLLAVGQLLPLLALGHGKEVLHASAARVDGRLIALTAAPGTGKSTTLAHLLAGGAEFFADDTLAIHPTDRGIVGSTGPRTINLHEHEAAALGSRVSRLGERLGATDKVHFEPPWRPHSSDPLRALVLLDRSRSDVRGSIEPVPDRAIRVLSSFYAGYYAEPARLRRQLDLVDALLKQVSLVRLVIGRDEQPTDVARRLKEWAVGLA